MTAVLLSPAAHASAPIEDHERIRETAEAHARMQADGIAPAGATVTVTAGRLDPRLRLPSCSVQPEGFTAPGQNGIPSSVGVRCPGDSPWTLYVPVRVEMLTDVLVLAVPRERGQPLRDSDLRVERRDVSRMTQSYLVDPAEVKGMVFSRRTLPGTVLSSRQLERERVVSRGERVRLRSGLGPLSVEVEGEALADAARGDRVRVRNIASGLVVEGTAAESGLVVTGRSRGGWQ